MLLLLLREHSSAQTQGRKLLQGSTAFCPDGCEDGFCQQSGTPGGLKCVKCKGNLLADKASGFCGEQRVAAGMGKIQPQQLGRLWA